MLLLPYVLALVAFYLVWIFVRAWLRPNQLPGPWEIPFLPECIALFRPFSGILDVIGKYIAEYGGVVQIQRMGRYYVLLSEPETVEALLTSSDNIKKGEHDYAFLKVWLREGLLLSYGNKWRYRRKLLTPTFHFKILEDAMGSLCKNSQLLTQNLLDTNGQPTEIDNIIRSSTLSVILETAMGVSSNNKEKYQKDYNESAKRVPELFMKRFYCLWKRLEFIYKRSTEGKAYYKHVEILHSFTKKVIESRKQKYLNEKDSETKQKNQRKPFLDHLIQMDISNPGTLSADDISEEVDTFMFEGHDTTAAALNSALFLLANHPAEQEKAAEEQKQIFGDDSRSPTFQDLHKMEYLEMIIKETLRLYPSVPLITRSITKDIKIDENTVIPAGFTAGIMIYFVHRSKKHWEDPEEFRPERFTPGTTRHPFAYIPFSAGPRNCIGQKFAMMELKTMLSGILRKCQIEPVTTSIKVLPTIVLKSEPSIKVKVKPRN